AASLATVGLFDEAAFSERLEVPGHVSRTLTQRLGRACCGDLAVAMDQLQQWQPCRMGERTHRLGVAYLPFGHAPRRGVLCVRGILGCHALAGGAGRQWPAGLAKRLVARTRGMISRRPRPTRSQPERVRIAPKALGVTTLL